MQGTYYTRANHSAAGNKKKSARSRCEKAKRRGTRGDSCQDTLIKGEAQRSQIKRQRDP